MRCYAVVDTNVIVSAVITKNPDSPPRQVFRAMHNMPCAHKNFTFFRRARLLF